jgi:hypothetical protein
MFVVVAAAYQRGDTHNPPLYGFERQSFGAGVPDLIAFSIPRHLYVSCTHHGRIAMQTRNARIVQPNMGRNRRCPARSKLATRREDTPRMGAQAGN